MPSLHSWNAETRQRNLANRVSSARTAVQEGPGVDALQEARSDTTPSFHSYTEETARRRVSSKRLCSQFQTCICSDAPTPLHTGRSLSSAFAGTNLASHHMRVSKGPQIDVSSSVPASENRKRPRLETHPASPAAGICRTLWWQCEVEGCNYSVYRHPILRGHQEARRQHLKVDHGISDPPRLDPGPKTPKARSKVDQAKAKQARIEAVRARQKSRAVVEEKPSDALFSGLPRVNLVSCKPEDTWHRCQMCSVVITHELSLHARIALKKKFYKEAHGTSGPDPEEKVEC